MDTPLPAVPTFDAQNLVGPLRNITPPAQTQNAPPPLFEWVAPTHYDHERTKRWYVVWGGIAFAIAFVALLTGAWSVSVVTVVVAATYAIAHHEETPLRRMRIERDGFTFGEVFVPWSGCKDFWLIKTPLFQELHIVRTSGSPREVCIHLNPEIDPTLLRTSLSQYLSIRPDQHERLLDIIIRLCKL